MAVILDFPLHHRARCRSQCEGCYYCEGGLFACTRCGGAESSLTTECCGKRMAISELGLVSAGLLDYVRGEWIYRMQETSGWRTLP